MPTNTDYPEVRKWPARPGNRLKWDEAIAFLAGFTQEQWAHTNVYVWRVWPVINREPKYIDIIRGPESMNYRYMLDTHGGGKYKLAISDLDQIEKPIYFNLDIPIVDAMPKLNYSELDLGHPDNKTYVQRLVNEGILSKDGRLVVDVTRQTEVSSVVQGMQSIVERLLQQLTELQKSGRTDEAALQKSMDLLSTAYNRAIETASGNRQSAANELTQLMQLVQTTIQTVVSQRNDSSMWQELIRMQNDAHAKHLELMNQLVAAKTNPDLDWIDRFGKIADVFGIKVSTGGRENKLQSLLEAAVPAIQSIERLVTNAMAIKRGMPPVQQQQQQIVEAPSDPVKDILRNYGQIILNSIGNGTSGDTFAYQVIDMFGMPVYQNIVSLGKDKILAGIKETPEFYNQVQHIMPTVEKFVDEFFDALNRDEPEM